MGVGPLYAIPKVLEKAGLAKEDVDFFEINEAFASQALYCVRELGIDIGKVNVWGGAIAMGHPLGCSAYRSCVYCVLRMELLIARVLSSWCEADCDGPEHCEADGKQDLRDEHVYRVGHGHGSGLRQ